jgi:two-component system response regulator QseB
VRVLLVEDDELLGDALRAWLIQDGYAVDWIQRGDSALEVLKTDEFDVVVLDIGLPGRSGLEVLKHARAGKVETPVLILTARDTTSDKVAGLDLGADDYLVKPINMTELSARIRAAIRRSNGRATPLLSYGDLALDPAALTVTKSGQPLTLTNREFAILHWLLENQNRVATRQRLSETLYGFDGDVIESNTAEVHISHLRQKIGEDVIKTVRGIGYMIKAQ